MADEIVVIVEPPLAEIEVVLSEVGLVGPTGEITTEQMNEVIDTVLEYLDDGPSLALLYENAKV